MLTVIFLLFFISLGILFYCLMTLIFKNSTLINRMSKYVEPTRKRENLQKTKSLNFQNISRIIGKKLSGAFFLKKYQVYLRRELERANILLKVEEVITMSFLFSMIGFIYYLLSKNLIMSVLISTFFWFVPVLNISSKKKKRINALNDQLGDLLVLISNSLKAGYSFLQSVDIASKEMQPPISEEFMKLLREINLGIPTEEALNNLTERVQNQNLEMVVTAILIQRQIGGNLAEVLDNISFTIRERMKLKGEIKTATAQARISGIIISMLPVFIAIIFFFINPSYISRLFTSPLGIGMLISGLIMQLIGAIVIKRIISIDL